MHRYTVTLQAAAAAFLIATTLPVWAQPEQGTASRESAFLQSFEGRFTGTGRLQRANGSDHNLTCKFSGDSQGAEVVLNGNCSTAVIFGTSIRISIRYDPKSGRYVGSFRERTGTIANLAGARKGETLSFSFVETAESVRPNPPARLTITRRSGNIVLSLRGTVPNKGQNLDLVLKDS
ncbi:hypothetical protein ACFQU1_22615 [Chelatococcus sp. GCM10030263]|uniref:hypothetical protein n=1 Tax=Chelatococcus sp. GCM10030263 TaxID=3273387 RepID=UPI003618C84E